MCSHNAYTVYTNTQARLPPCTHTFTQRLTQSTISTGTNTTHSSWPSPEALPPPLSKHILPHKEKNRKRMERKTLIFSLLCAKSLVLFFVCYSEQCKVVNRESAIFFHGKMFITYNQGNGGSQGISALVYSWMKRGSSILLSLWCRMCRAPHYKNQVFIMT